MSTGNEACKILNILFMQASRVSITFQPILNTVHLTNDNLFLTFHYAN